MSKKRLDISIVERGLINSRSKAQTLIMVGDVKVNGAVITKAGHQVSEEDEIVVKDTSLRFVSRGGEKLIGAIEKFKININEKICLDVGASTGGFTDCLLKNGAKKVYSVDVGYGQLDWKLRNDDRVINIEKTNIRYWDAKELSDDVDIVTVDVSFISLKKVLPKIKDILKDGYKIIALIKPQFEVGRERIGKHGVVKEQSYRDEVIQDIKNFSIDLGYEVKGICESPIKGPKGNVEYFIYLSL